ncbi:hypothetical protein PTTG_28338 [Puccinia triticina 1-1 BBBD Race 1]|uniref:Uncharacterized protein n=2 Tax=Puccinia triticina TaxID=208348 RepID=A0A180GCN8_PUCT1|nr:uncharacterized protein PtA15_4A788 [Puccinia triticina]OAV90391.1 hypothetical protein PTTG_28338 [Puccinia triticina 1-1 BBBD Race 1]WAQ84335.1 hypothetical protein PtA15_4A788 [Puccinia triticina]WAR55153.1 hypothetical protein PtB15_4B773 [Puccinia triticina]
MLFDNGGLEESGDQVRPDREVKDTACQPASKRPKFGVNLSLCLSLGQESDAANIPGSSSAQLSMVHNIGASS